MSNLNLGIIGAGYIAEEHLKAIKQIDGMSVEMIFSRTIEKSATLSRKYNIPLVCHDFNDFKKNIKKIDGILILVSVENMFEITKLLIPFKTPLFIEKPPALALDQINDLISLADNYKTPNMVGFNRRFYSIYDKGLRIIHEHGGLLGLSIEGHERFWKIKDTITAEVRDKWLFANSSHTIDLIDFFGGDLAEIKILSDSLEENHGDQFVALMKYKSGAIGTYTSHWYSPGGWSVSLYGDGVTVVYKPLESGKWIDKNFNEHEIKPSEYDLDLKEGFYQQMLTFKDLIQNGKLNWPAVSIKDSLPTMKNIEKFYLDYKNK